MIKFKRVTLQSLRIAKAKTMSFNLGAKGSDHFVSPFASRSTLSYFVRIPVSRLEAFADQI